MTPTLLTVKEVAARLRISESKAYELLPSIGWIDIGKIKRVYEDDLDRYEKKIYHRPKSERPF